jgi:hypothetical protein
MKHVNRAPRDQGTTSEAGRLAASSRLLSLSQKMSRLALSLFTGLS